jgi:hypothetical protein
MSTIESHYPATASKDMTVDTRERERERENVRVIAYNGIVFIAGFIKMPTGSKV